MDNKSDIYRWVAAWVRGDITPDELVHLEHWLDAAPRNRQWFDSFTEKENLKKSIMLYSSFDSDKKWKEMEILCERKKKRSFLSYWKYAAVAAILLVVGVSSLLLEKTVNPSVMIENQTITPGSVKALLVLASGNQISLTDSIVLKQVLEQHSMKVDEDTKIEYNTVIVPRGGEYSLALSDGTRIKMNSDSKLIFPNKFIGKERRVCLEGEALFDVTRDREHPFVVETKQGSVQVVGTLFNVNVYSDEEVMRTTLVEGKITFKGNGMSQNVNLNPGEQVVYDIKSCESHIVKVNPKVYIGWAEGKWFIEGQRLEDIMKQLSRWYDVEVFYKNSEAKELVFTGDLEKYNNCEEVLNIISMTTNVEFIIKDRVVIVQMK